MLVSASSLRAAHWELPTTSAYQFSDGCSAARFSTNGGQDIGAGRTWTCTPKAARTTTGFSVFWRAEGGWIELGGASLVCAPGENSLGVCENNVAIDDDNTCKTNGHRGNPVNAILGNKIETVIDFESAGPYPLRLERFFPNNGQAYYPFAVHSFMGRGWRTNFDAVLVFNGFNSGVFVVLPDGKHYHFRKPSPSSTEYLLISYRDGNFIERKGAGVKLVWSGTDWILTLNDGRRLYFTEDPANIYNMIKLSKIEFPGGYTQQLSYSDEKGPKQISSITDSYGRSMTFELEVESKNISKVFVNGVEAVAYLYEDAFNDPSFDSVYSGETNDLKKSIVRLKKVDYPSSSGESLIYHYDDNRHHGALTGVTDGRNIRVQTITYDASRRVISSKRAGGLYEHQFGYGSGTRTITNPLGKQEIITLSAGPAGKEVLTSSQGVASANCAASNTTFEYDTNYWVSKETDAEGRVTTYVNEGATGLPTTIVRGFGTLQSVTTTVQWNTTWRVPTKVIEPGLTTDFTWDTAGKLTTVKQTDTTTQTVPFSTAGRTRIWTYGYDTSGKLTSVDGPLAGAGDTTSYTYNAQGFVQTMINEVGHVTTVTTRNFRDSQSPWLTRTAS